jgi:hypothetical protein
MESRFLGKISLILILAVAFSCSTENFKDEPLEVANAIYYDGICRTDCFSSGGPYVVKDGSITINAGINSKEMSYTAYNTETVFVVEATYYVTEGNSKVDARIIIDINGNEIIFDKVASGSTVTHFIYLDTNWNSCDQINYTIEQVALGKPVKFSGVYELVPECTSTEPLQIGDEAKGGIIAYLLQEGDPGYDPNVQHGLVVPPSDQSNGIQWYNGNYFTTGATATTLGTGQSNTTTIVNSQGLGNYASQLCDDLVYNFYTDWYLPSSDEMIKILENAEIIGGFQESTGDPTNGTEGMYWTSSEYEFSSDTQAYSVIWQFGLPSYTIMAYPTNKNELMRVRPVRSF